MSIMIAFYCNDMTGMKYGIWKLCGSATMISECYCATTNCFWEAAVFGSSERTLGGPIQHQMRHGLPIGWGLGGMPACLACPGGTRVGLSHPPPLAMLMNERMNDIPDLCKSPCSNATTLAWLPQRAWDSACAATTFSMRQNKGLTFRGFHPYSIHGRRKGARKWRAPSP